MASLLKFMTTGSVKTALFQGFLKNKTVESTLVGCSKLHTSSRSLQDDEAPDDTDGENQVEVAGTPVGMMKGEKVPVCDVETSMRYMQSNAYQVSYMGEPVWVPYRRNFKGAKPPSKTRKKCIRGGIMSTGNPCPICRDEFLIVHHKNIELLKQFLSPISGELLPMSKTGVCQNQHNELQLAVMKAVDEGTLKTKLPRRQYRYEDYYPHLRWQAKSEHTSQQNTQVDTDTVTNSPKEEMDVPS